MEVICLFLRGGLEDGVDGVTAFLGQLDINILGGIMDDAGIEIEIVYGIANDQGTDIAIRMRFFQLLAGGNCIFDEGCFQASG